MRSSRLLTTAAATAALMTLGLGAASAHVTATPSTTAAGSSTLLTFALAHGCEGSPTTAVTITLPAELNAATATVNPNWDISTAVETLASPVTLANGSQISERTKSITYTAKAPLADHQRDTFTLALQLPDADGTELVFPTLQQCESGQTDWSEVPAPGADHDSVDAPAPSLTITAAAAGHDAHGGATSSEAAEGTFSGSSVGLAGSGTAWAAWLGLAAGVGGLLLGGTAFWRAGRSRRSS